MLRPEAPRLCCRAAGTAGRVLRRDRRPPIHSLLPPPSPTTTKTKTRTNSSATRLLLARSFSSSFHPRAASSSSSSSSSSPEAQRAEPPSSTPAPPPPPPTSSSSAASTSSAQYRRARRRYNSRVFYYGAVCALLGTIGGVLFRLTVVPPAPPARGGPEDAYLAAEIAKRGAALPLVQSLEDDPEWDAWDAYSGLAEGAAAAGEGGGGREMRDGQQPAPGEVEEKGAGSSGRLRAVRSRITSGPMAGASGLAFQRVFHRARTGEVVSVVYFGSGLGGWPGVTHGGALATVLDESLGRCAIMRFPARTGVTARLELQYRAPTLTNDFYVIRTRPETAPPRLVGGEEEDEEEAARRRRRAAEEEKRKLWVEGALETLDGRVCVEARGLFVVPKTFRLKPLVERF
ncbi:hypothetical protein GGR56DRAFT_693413 [Xylariaceae sp. FL0804]|nr:hypothetical protein GGR56DRAFT_693413 [Xylariaceae sp. FL0804]